MRGSFREGGPSPFHLAGGSQLGLGGWEVGIAKGAMHLLLQDLVGHPHGIQRAYSKGLHGHRGHPPVLRDRDARTLPREGQVPKRVLRHRRPSCRRPLARWLQPPRTSREEQPPLQKCPLPQRIEHAGAGAQTATSRTGHASGVAPVRRSAAHRRFRSFGRRRLENDCDAATPEPMRCFSSVKAETELRL